MCKLPMKQEYDKKPEISLVYVYVYIEHWSSAISNS